MAPNVPLPSVAWRKQGIHVGVTIHMSMRFSKPEPQFGRRFSTRRTTLALLLGAGGWMGPAGCTEAVDLPDLSDTPGPGVDGLRLERIASGLSSPIDLTAPAGDDRVFIAEQVGRIRIVDDGELVDEPFIDIAERVVGGGERGLLGLAFPPDYATSGMFYVNYTGAQGASRVSRFRVSADPDRADPESEQVLLTVEQPFSNHNGGQIAFGPDGMLYVAMGDGGSGGDPLGSGQDANSLLGALLRLDVSGDGGYRIPPDNPYVGTPNRRGELWAIGLRNPWRFSFDFPSGQIFIGDVGQNRFEEINAAPASAAGNNYGWNEMEGMECFQSGCSTSAFTLPVYVYGRGDGCSVTGGVVYRGSDVPALQGAYLFADYCQGWIRSFALVDGRPTDLQQLNVSASSPSAFGVDSSGEVYVLSLDGSVYKFELAES